MRTQDFDHTVEFRDSKSGQVIRRNDYVLKISGAGREYERPPGSGLIYAPDGALLRDEGKEKREQLEAQAKAKAEAEQAEIAKAKAKEREELLESVRAEVASENAAKKAESEGSATASSSDSLRKRA